MPGRSSKANWNATPEEKSSRVRPGGWPASRYSWRPSILPRPGLQIEQPPLEPELGRPSAEPSQAPSAGDDPVARNDYREAVPGHGLPRRPRRVRAPRSGCQPLVTAGLPGWHAPARIPCSTKEGRGVVYVDGLVVEGHRLAPEVAAQPELQALETLGRWVSVCYLSSEQLSAFGRRALGQRGAPEPFVGGEHPHPAEGRLEYVVVRRQLLGPAPSRTILDRARVKSAILMPLPRAGHLVLVFLGPSPHLRSGRWRTPRRCGSPDP